MMMFYDDGSNDYVSDMTIYDDDGDYKCAPVLHNVRRAALVVPCNPKSLLVGKLSSLR